MVKLADAAFAETTGGGYHTLDEVKGPDGSPLRVSHVMQWPAARFTRMTHGDVSGALAESIAEHLPGLSRDEDIVLPTPLDEGRDPTAAEVQSAWEVFEDGWRAWLGRRPTLGDVDRLIDTLSEAEGGESAGNSQRSDGSRRSTGRR